jgi:hypothetical protein
VCWFPLTLFRSAISVPQTVEQETFFHEFRNDFSVVWPEFFSATPPQIIARQARAEKTAGLPDRLGRLCHYPQAKGKQNRVAKLDSADVFGTSG